jgi:radical SAM protein with 4Fe4S-binding SPASM domain
MDFANTKIKKEVVALSKKKIADPSLTSSCFFRTTVAKPYRKALLQITEKCNLRCKHCFVAAQSVGREMTYDQIANFVLPKLITLKVISVTLTGGEPFCHQRLMEITKLFVNNQIKVSLCTNGTMLADSQLSFCQNHGVKFNVSLDGFSELTHSVFRGKFGCFELTKNNLIKLGEAGCLKGILSTPNELTPVEEYEQICEFAIDRHAEYVLFNPLTAMGRGSSALNLRMCQERMVQIMKRTQQYSSQIDVVYIRFPNFKFQPLSACEAGRIFYIFANGEVTICPYLVFAAKNEGSFYNYNNFIIGNIFCHNNLSERINDYNFDFIKMGRNSKCETCEIRKKCGQGCAAGVMANGGRIGELDLDVCRFGL